MSKSEKVKCDSCDKEIICDIAVDALSGGEYLKIPTTCPYCFNEPIKIDLDIASLELFE